jgi:hypothetical protein
MKSETDGIRAVIFQEGEVWVAQCLEYDIGAQAQDLDTLQRRLRVAIEVEQSTSLEVHGRAFAGIDRAPKCFFEMWEEGLRAFATKLELKNGGFGLNVALCA